MRKSVKKAAVLVPFIIRKNKLNIILTLRNPNLSYHSGQICFPGGKIEEGETPCDTALRETEEEINIPRKLIEIVAEIPEEMAYTSDFLITPIIGIVDKGALPNPNESEVSEVILIPLSDLFRLPVREESVIIDGEKISYPVYEWKGYKIWGATARIIKKLLERKDILNELNRRAYVHIRGDMESN